METGIIEIIFNDGSKWNVHFENSSQKNKLLIWRNLNKEKIKSFEFVCTGVHSTKQFLNFKG